MDVVSFVNEINSAKKSKKLTELDAYVALFSDPMRGVAITCDDDVVIDESFNKIFIKNFVFNIDGRIEHVIYLFMKENTVPKLYASLALDFLDLEKREIIKKNPLSWFDEWRNTVGETKTDNMVYDVIGEMFVLRELQKSGMNPSWDSATKGTFDISTKKANYEVKTSIDKTKTQVTIHSRFQLDVKKTDVPLFLTYVRVEANGSGESIDSLYNDLIKEGFSKEVLDSYLKEKGYYVGKTDRYIEYSVHEVRLYPVDDNFPKITDNSFKNDKIPANISNIEYCVSLDGLQYLKMY